MHFITLMVVVLLLMSQFVHAGENKNLNSQNNSPNQIITLRIGGSNIFYSILRYSRAILKKFSIEPTVYFLFDKNKIGELFYANFLYRIGLGKFSIHLMGGPGFANTSSIYENYSNWAYNYGIGSLISLKENFSIRMDLSVNEVYSHEQLINTGTGWAKTGKGFNRDLALFIGLTYSIH